MRARLSSHERERRRGRSPGRRPRRLDTVAHFAVDLPEGQPFTRTGRRVVALSADGSRLTFVANRQIYLRNLNELTAAPIPGTENTDPAEPVFSPDGQWLAFWSNNAVRRSQSVAEYRPR